MCFQQDKKDNALGRGRGNVQHRAPGTIGVFVGETGKDQSRPPPPAGLTIGHKCGCVSLGGRGGRGNDAKAVMPCQVGRAGIEQGRTTLKKG